MNFLQTYAKEIVSFFTPLVIWVLNFFFKPKANIVYANPHIFTFLIQEDAKDENGNLIKTTQTVYTITHLVFNNGRQTARNVEITFNWRPMYLNMWPIRIYEEHLDKDARYTIKLDTLAPKEGINIELLSVKNELPNLINVRSEDCSGKLIQLVPQPIVTGWMRGSLLLMIFLGVVTSIYLVVTLIQFLVLKTHL